MASSSSRTCRTTSATAPKARPTGSREPTRRHEHVPRSPLPGRAGGAGQLSLPARLGASAAVVHAEDAQHAEPRRLRPARVGPVEPPAGSRLLLLLAAAPG